MSASLLQFSNALTTEEKCNSLLFDATTTPSLEKLSEPQLEPRGPYFLKLSNFFHCIFSWGLNIVFFVQLLLKTDQWRVNFLPRDALQTGGSDR